MRELLFQTQKLYYSFENYLFDSCYNVQTRGAKDLHEMNISSLAIEHARRYEPTPIPVLKKVLRQLPINHQNFTFVDLGSGKGLALLLASTFNFQRIIGIELAQELYQLSLVNIEKFQEQKNLNSEIEVYFDDFSKWQDKPKGPVIYFMFNPCDAEMIESLMRSVEITHEQTYFLYINPLRGFIIENHGYQLIKVYPHKNSNFLGHLYQYKSLSRF